MNAPSRAPQCGFLFATFRGEHSPLSEQVHFATSRDGRHWSALNHGEPILVSAVGECGVRDPFILRAADGSGFFLIGTDLSIHRNGDWSRAIRAGSRSLLVWHSPDLVAWHGPTLAEVAPPDAGCTWAPEAVFDAASGDYLVFWASTTGRDNFAKHRIWAARTPDFRSFGAPFVFIEKPTTIIDTTILHDGSRYFRFTKDEKHKAITQETAVSLSGPWSEVPGFSLSQMVGYEGPQGYRIAPEFEGGPAVWCLILDHYARGEGYQPFVTSDLAAGDFSRAGGFSFPFRFRHGSVLPLAPGELDRLENAFGTPTGT